jgi:polysaccharide biosynthesis/export protein
MRKLLYVFVSSALFWVSCVSPEKLRKEYVYFNEGLDSSKLNTYQLVEPVIQKGDLLQITISSRSSSTNQLFSQNYSNTVSGAIGAGSAVQAPGADGYLVDITTGEVKLPLLGAIRADGMTKLELEKEIIKRASDYLKEDPIVNIRYMNFRVTFLGMINSPGTITFDSERVSFLQAIGQVGGIKQGGDLKNILIFREQNGKRTMHIADITKGDIFNSPDYYLKQNDVVIVSPTDRQLLIADESAQKKLQFVTLGLSFVNIIFILITVFR